MAGGVDRQLVRHRLELIVTSLDHLRRYARVERGAFLASRELPSAAESRLRRALEAVFDIGRHVLARTGHVDLAQEYKAIARGLADHGIVSEDLREALLAMAGYRNRLVHLYHLVTDEELYDIIQHDLSDLERFVSEIQAYLDDAHP